MPDLPIGSFNINSLLTILNDGDTYAADRRHAIDMLLALFDGALAETRVAIIQMLVTLTVESDNILAFSYSLDAAVDINIECMRKYPMDQRLLAILHQSAQSPSSQVRAVAVKYIGFADDPTVFPVLLNALQDADSLVRVAATQGLAGIGNEVAIDPLDMAANDLDDDVRYSAFVALQRYHSPTTIPILRKGLHDIELRVRIIAFRATLICVFRHHEYGHYDFDDDRSGTPADTEYLDHSALMERDLWRYRYLIDAIGSRHEYRQVAIETLTTITGQHFGDDARRWMAWYDEQKKAIKEREWNY